MLVHSYIRISTCTYEFAIKHAVFPEFDCLAAADKLKKQLGTLTKLKYTAMMGSLFAKDIITNEERIKIDDKSGEEKMMYLIVDIVIPSLKQNFHKKYKGLLEAMEESDDIDLKSTAENLGKLITFQRLKCFYALPQNIKALALLFVIINSYRYTYYS